MEEADLVRAVLEHYRSTWGEPSFSRLHEVEDQRITVSKWPVGSGGNPQDVSLYATLGCSIHPIVGHNPTHRMEFYTGLLPERDEVMPSLAALAAFPRAFGGSLMSGHTLDLPGPAWPGTTMHRFLVVGPIEETMPSLSLSDGTNVEFLQGIAIYDSELEFIRRHGPDALRRRWLDKDVPFEDPNRPPSV